MPAIDINCDMGEEMGNDEFIMPFISSANIACGYHAGDRESMKRTIELAKKNHIAIGAHPSFFDKENFGRTEVNLPAHEIYDLVILQLRAIDQIIIGQREKMHHVKPHGALYNMSAKHLQTAAAIAQAVKDFNENLILFGLSGSYSIKEAEKLNLKTANEVFADRTYGDDGSLTSRSQPTALIEDVDKSAEQVLQMIKNKTVRSLNGNVISIVADTICIHGDGRNAVELARHIYQVLKQNNIDIKAI